MRYEDNELFIVMPTELTAPMLRALWQDETTKCADKEKMYERIGWLICAWDVLVQTRETEDPFAFIGADELGELVRNRHSGGERRSLERG